jgi:hypothetical protein
MPSSNDESAPQSLDARFVATIGCVPAIALAFILTLNPLIRARFSEVSDLLLGLYATYSVVLYLAARWWRPFLPGVLEPWIDVGWARGPMALSSDASRILFPFSFFALLIAAFQGGVQLGLHIVLGSALLIACVGAILSFGRADFEVHHVLVGPTSILSSQSSQGLRGDL